MGAQQIVNMGTVIDGATMDADITYAAKTSKLIDLGDNTTVGVEYKTTQGAGSPDHVGVLRFRVTNDPDNTPNELTAYATAIATGAVRQGSVEMTGIAGRYLEIFYDRTSGGDDDTLTVTAVVKRGGGSPAATASVLGTVTANAGTDLNTSALALESGGNLATIAGDTTSLDGKVTACNTGAIAGTVTADAGTNLNTSALALESGGNLATIAGDTTSLDGKVPSLGQAAPSASVPVVFPKIVNTAAPVRVAVGASSTTSAQLATGQYIITSDVDCFFLAGGSGVTALSTSRYLPADAFRSLYVTGSSDDYVAVIQESAAGFLSIEKVE